MTPEIRLLPPDEARKIAAGEVIDRPSALVREFLDNAIDAGGRLIEVFVEDGGIRRTEVVDDGIGMGKEDIELCWLTHATSKIRSLDDLMTFDTLGFRGEALSAAAAVSRLEILSSKDGREAWKLNVGPGANNPALLELSRRAAGTSVRALGLFDTLPARKRFLKRSGSEASACLQIFNEKALAFPKIAFRFTQDGVLKAFLPQANSFRERFAQIFLMERESVFLHEIAANDESFSVSIVAGGPELFRRDRRLQFVFANSRRIQDFSLLQAFEYGLQGWFPNDAHPLGAVFIKIDPALADFNIHPAKREARFLDPGAIHHAVSTALRDFCRRFSITRNLSDDDYKFNHRGTQSYDELFHSEKPFGKTLATETSPPGERLAIEALESSFAAEEVVPYSAGGHARYLGRLFGLFILVEKENRLFIIDQHAAHERILYDKFINGPAPKQELLVPIPFITESPEDDSFLDEKQEELAKLGIVIKREKNEWLIEALPSNWRVSDRETVAEILNLRTAKENMAERWAATISCRAAVKDGDFLDEQTAISLAKEAFAGNNHLCPHGRPIWFEISREDLFRAVKRS